MEVIGYTNAPDFARDAMSFLMRKEAQNNLIIGRSMLLAQKELPADALLAAVKDGDELVAVAMMTPPHHLVLTDAPDTAIDHFARWVCENRLSPPGIAGPVASTKRFAAAWCVLAGAEASLRRSLRVFQLDRVIPSRGASGSFHPATLDDVELIMNWSEAFAESIGESNPTVRESALKRVRDGNFFLWKDPQPVSMAAWAGPTPGGIRINAVFTPPALRNRGYASACVAALSQHLLDSGKRFCFLYTDLANPTSNSIYQKIGYRAVCDWSDYKL